MLRFLVILFFCSLNSNAQGFSSIGTKVDLYPAFSKVENLANQIDNDFESDEEKVKATFYWLAKNIRYNLREFYNPKQRSYRFSYSSEAERLQKLQAIKDRLINKAFLTKLGVCEEYAQSFKKVCDLLGIEAFVIKGYVRINTSEIGVIPSSTNHAWNAVKLNGKFIILDATWAAGYEFQNRWVRDFNPYYYDISNQDIFKTHYPKDRLWILRFGRMAIDEFFNQPIYANSFLKSGAALETPKLGVLQSDDDNFTFSIKNLPATIKIAYAMPGMRYAQRANVTRINGVTSFTIPNPKRKSELLIYFNQKDALRFRIP